MWLHWSRVELELNFQSTKGNILPFWVCSFDMLCPGFLFSTLSFSLLSPSGHWSVRSISWSWMHQSGTVRNDRKSITTLPNLLVELLLLSLLALVVERNKPTCLLRWCEVEPTHLVRTLSFLYFSRVVADSSSNKSQSNWYWFSKMVHSSRV